MKKLALFVISFFLLTACTEESYYEVYTYTQTYTVHPGDWKDAGSYLYYTFTEKAITNNIYDYGVMNAYAINFPINDYDEVLTPLPYDEFIMEQDGYRWTAQYTCEFEPGAVTFILKYNNFETWLQPDYPMIFRIRLMK